MRAKLTKQKVMSKIKDIIVEASQEDISVSEIRVDRKTTPDKDYDGLIIPTTDIKVTFKFDMDTKNANMLNIQMFQE